MPGWDRPPGAGSGEEVAGSWARRRGDRRARPAPASRWRWVGVPAGRPGPAPAGREVPPAPRAARPAPAARPGVPAPGTPPRPSRALRRWLRAVAPGRPGGLARSARPRAPAAGRPSGGGSGPARPPPGEVAGLSACAHRWGRRAAGPGGGVPHRPAHRGRRSSELTSDRKTSRLREPAVERLFATVPNLPPKRCDLGGRLRRVTQPGSRAGAEGAHPIQVRGEPGPR